MSDLSRFEKWCEARGIELLPHQRTFAASILQSTDAKVFLMGGTASGRTFVMEALERFTDDEREAKLSDDA